MTFIRDAFLNNRWLWVHIGGGGLLAKLAFVFSPAASHALLTVLIVALLWELTEFLTTNVDETYGSRTRFFADSFGDVLGALAMAVIVVW